MLKLLVCPIALFALTTLARNSLAAAARIHVQAWVENQTDISFSAPSDLAAANQVPLFEVILPFQWRWHDPTERERTPAQMKLERSEVHALLQKAAQTFGRLEARESRVQTSFRFSVARLAKALLQDQVGQIPPDGVQVTVQPRVNHCKPGGPCPPASGHTLSAPRFGDCQIIAYPPDAAPTDALSGILAVRCTSPTYRIAQKQYDFSKVFANVRVRVDSKDLPTTHDPSTSSFLRLHLPPAAVATAGVKLLNFKGLAPATYDQSVFPRWDGSETDQRSHFALRLYSPVQRWRGRKLSAPTSRSGSDATGNFVREASELPIPVRIEFDCTKMRQVPVCS